MTGRINWRLGVISVIAVLIVCVPFTGLKTAIILGIVSGLFILLVEGGLYDRIARLRILDFTRLKESAPIESAIKPAVNFLSNRPALILIATFIASIALPLTLNRYQTDVVTLAIIYVTLAVGLNIIVGLCGLLALGYIAFYAVGAYTYALLNVNFGVNFFLCLPIGFATGAIAGALVGLPVLRLRGDYLAIVTLGFGEIVRIILNNWDELTAGPNGIMNIARPSIFGFNLGTKYGYYYLAVALAIIVMFTQVRLIGSKIGRAWEAIREDELAASHAGVPVFRMKMLAMILGGAWAGAAGALFAARMTHVSPESFTFLESVLVLCMVVLGGMGSVTGVTIGALALIVAPELLRGFANYRMLGFGLLLVLMMRFRASGLIPGKRLRVKKGEET